MCWGKFFSFRDGTRCIHLLICYLDAGSPIDWHARFFRRPLPDFRGRMFALPRARTSHVYVMSEKRVLGYVYVYVFSLGLPAVFHAWTGVSLPRRSPAPKSDARTEDCNGLIAASEISKRGAVDSTVEGGGGRPLVGGAHVFETAGFGGSVSGMMFPDRKRSVDMCSGRALRVLGRASEGLASCSGVQDAFPHNRRCSARALPGASASVWGSTPPKRRDLRLAHRGLGWRGDQDSPGGGTGRIGQRREGSGQWWERSRAVT